MKNIISKPSVIVAFAVLITLLALICVCSPVRVDAKMEGDTDYMTSENLALGASVSEADGANAVDGKRSTSLTLKKKDNSSVTLDFGKEVTFNTIVLKEEGLNVKDFEIFASRDGETFTRIFASDKIEYHRLCSVDKTTARYVHLELNRCDDLPSISEIEIYNEPSRNADGFRVAGYVSGTWLDIAKNSELSEEEKRASVLEDMDRFNIGLLTHIFYYCGAGITEEGDVYFGSPELKGEDKAAEAVAKIYREHAAEAISEFAASVDIAALVTRKVEEMETDELESLLLSVMKKELGAIVNLGALLGAIVGIFNSLLAIFL